MGMQRGYHSFRVGSVEPVGKERVRNLGWTERGTAIKSVLWPGAVAQACNPSTQEAEAGELPEPRRRRLR